MAKKTNVRKPHDVPWWGTIFQAIIIFLFTPLIFFPAILNFFSPANLIILMFTIIIFIAARIIIFLYKGSFNYKYFWITDIFFFILICGFMFVLSAKYESIYIALGFFGFIIFPHSLIALYNRTSSEDEINPTRRNLQKFMPHLASETKNNEKIFIKTMFTKYNSSLPITLEEALKVLEDKKINLFSNGTYKAKTAQGILNVFGINNFNSVKRGIDDLENKILNNINSETILQYVSIIRKNGSKSSGKFDFKPTNYKKMVTLYKTLQQYQKDSAHIEP